MAAREDFRAGENSVLTLETAPRVRRYLAEASERLPAKVTERTRGGLAHTGTEGALVFARAEHSMRALDLVEQQLLGLAATLV